MKVTLTPTDLIAFEDSVCEAFGQKKILAPVHLDSGNEEQLIHVFQNYVNEDDWVCCTWRSHYRTLLKNVPREEVMQEILNGKSISLCFPEHNVVSSAIVGGIMPIAVGIALAIKRNGGKNKVICFVGDMGASTGLFSESHRYAVQHDLPIIFVIEDNGKSVCTDTKSCWNSDKSSFEPDSYLPKSVVWAATKILYYQYESRHPHAGVGGARIQF